MTSSNASQVVIDPKGFAPVDDWEAVDGEAWHGLPRPLPAGGVGFDVGDLGCDEVATWLATTEEAQQPLKLRLDPTAFTLATLGDAHAKVETGHSDGKLVIVVSA